MDHITFVPTVEQLNYTFGGAEPIMRVRPGTVLTLWTEDAYGGRITSRAASSAPWRTSRRRRASSPRRESRAVELDPREGRGPSAPRSSRRLARSLRPFARARRRRRRHPGSTRVRRPSREPGRRRGRPPRESTTRSTRRLRHGFRRASRERAPAGRRRSASRPARPRRRNRRIRLVVIATYGFEMSSPSMSSGSGGARRCAISGSAIRSAEVNWLDTSPRTRRERAHGRIDSPE